MLYMGLRNYMSSDSETLCIEFNMTGTIVVLFRKTAVIEQVNVSDQCFFSLQWNPFLVGAS